MAAHHSNKLLALLLSTLLGSALGLYNAGSDVVTLNPSNFKTKTSKSSIVLVEFFAPWCGHCQSLAPAWEKAATALKGVVSVAAVDCDAHKEIAQEYGIKGFPTIKVFIPGKSTPVDYNGGRDAKAIVDYALQSVKSLVGSRLSGKSSSSSGGSSSKEGPSASVELDSSNFDEKVIQSKGIWLVEFFAPWCGHCKRLAPEWKRAASNLKGKANLGQVDCTQEQSLCQRFNVQGFPTILFFGSDKENPSPYEGPRSASGIEEFALDSLAENIPSPEVYELTGPEVMEEHCTSAPLCLVAFLPDILDSTASGRNAYISTLKAVAENFKKNQYGYVWTAANLQPDLEKALGVGGYGYPALIALNVKKQVYAPFKSSFQEAHINEFIRSLRSSGSRTNVPLEAEPKVVSVESWDGQDGQLPVEEEFSLDELE